MEKDNQIQSLEKQVEDRDVRIRLLQAELDRFKQKPGTITSLVPENSGKVQHGRDGYTCIDGHVQTGPKTSTGRIKRFAISAEPNSTDQSTKAIEKWPKALE